MTCALRACIHLGRNSIGSATHNNKHAIPILNKHGPTDQDICRQIPGRTVAAHVTNLNPKGFIQLWLVGKVWFRGKVNLKISRRVKYIPTYILYLLCKSIKKAAK